MDIQSTDSIIYYCARKVAARNHSAPRHAFHTDEWAESQIRERWAAHINRELAAFESAETLTTPDKKEIRHLRSLGRKHKVGYNAGALATLARI